MFEKCSETFVKPSEQFWKIFGNLRKVVGNLRKVVINGVYIINRIIHGRAEIWNLSSRVHIRYLTRSLRSLVRYRCEHSKINSISPRAHVLFSIYYMATIVRPLWLAAERALFSCNDRALWKFISVRRPFWVLSKSLTSAWAKTT